MLGTPRRRLIDTNLIQWPVVTAALVIAVVMLVPPFSPVLDSQTALPMFEGRGISAQEIQAVAGLTDEIEPRDLPERVQAKGILLNGYSAGNTGDRLDDLIALIKRTELNAVVIDIKDEAGEVSWLTETPEASVADAGIKKMDDPKATIQRLKDEGIYVIGRIVTFQDTKLSAIRPDIALQDRHGGIWRNAKGLGWLDPYSAEAQNYNIALAVEAIELGFQEIQFDYVRFPTDGDTSRLWSRHKDDREPAEVIRGFLARAREQINPRGAYLSADLFGLVALVRDDLGIGQRLELIADEVDYVSLMLYPSHYNKPEYGIPDPEKEPGRTVAVSLADAKERMEGRRARLRPWLQDFTLTVPYTPVEVAQQIQAVEEAGIGEWLLWNARNRYTEDALRPAPDQRAPPPEDSRVTR